MFDVGVVGRNVGDEVQVALLFAGVDVGLFFKGCWRWMHVGHRGAKRGCRCVPTVGECLLEVLTVGEVRKNVGGFRRTLFWAWRDDLGVFFQGVLVVGAYGHSTTSVVDPHWGQSVGQFSRSEVSQDTSEVQVGCRSLSVSISAGQR